MTVPTLVLPKSSGGSIVALLVEVLGEVGDDLADQLGREVVSHPWDELELRTGNRRGRRLPTGRIDKGVGFTVDHESRSHDRGQSSRAIRLEDNGSQLSRSAARVKSPVVGGSRVLANSLLVKGKAG